MFGAWESVLLKGTVSRNMAVIKACLREMGEYPVLQVEHQSDDNADLTFLDYYAVPSLNPGFPQEAVPPTIRARVSLTQLDDDVCELQITDDNPDRIWREKLRIIHQEQNPGTQLPETMLPTEEDQQYYEFREALMIGLRQRGSLCTRAPSARDSNTARINNTPKNKFKRGRNIETEEKLKRLLEIRDASIKKGQVDVSWSLACNLAGIRAETASRYVSSLQKRWKEVTYRPEITEIT
jgi:hypothetical protein